MKSFVRVEFNAAIYYAQQVEDQLELWSAAPWAGGAPLGQRVPVQQTRSLCPVTPSKILAVGRNYRAHAREMGGEAPSYPLIFMKPPSALTHPGQPVVLPRQSQRVDYEGELAVILGSRARNVSRAQALQHVFGYTSACDVTARDLQDKDGQWTRAKGFDTFCPLAAQITTDVDAGALEVSTRVNGSVRQQGNTADMVFSVAEIVEFISSVMTLEAGDVILTGTPEGIGPMQPGDQVEVNITSLCGVSFTVNGS